MSREVANFMQMYPSYRLQDVLNEYAITFFTLLREGHKIKYKSYLMLLNITSAALSSNSATEKFIRELEWAAEGTDAIIKSESEGSSPAAIKKILGG